MLKLRNLNIQKSDRTIVSVPFLEMSSGEHVGILGPNGAGKSSLLKVICGEWVSTTGAVEFHGQPITQWSRTLLARQMGVLPQASRVEFPFTAFEVVAIGATPLAMKKRELPLQVACYMRITDCFHLANESFTQLSGGEKQRVHLARVLLQLSQAEQAPLLLLDEPTSAQDLGHQHQLMALIKQYVKDQSYGVLSVLHDLNIASRYCDRVWLIDNKCVQAEGQPEAVLTPECIDQHWHYSPDRVSGSRTTFGLL